MRRNTLFKNNYQQATEINTEVFARSSGSCLNTAPPEKAFGRDFIVIDVETTGLSPETNSIIQLSAVHYVDHQECDSFSTYINPLCHIPSKVTALTGIDDLVVADAPTFAEIENSFLDFVGRSPLLTGYNFSFDLRFLSAAVGFQMAERYLCFDTLTLARRWISSIGYKLCQVSAAVGFQTQFHDALNDCRACGEVLNYICRIANPEDLQIRYCTSSGCCQRNQNLQTYLKQQQSNLNYPFDIDLVIADGALHGKLIVFTGALSFGRAIGEEMAQRAGAQVRGSVSKRTDYLVVGEQDYTLVGDDGLSNKEEKARQLIDECGVHINIISEHAFLRLLRERV